MKITFVQNEKEKEAADRAIRAGLSHRNANVGTWILPPSRSVDRKFVVVDSPTGKDVFVKQFDTIDGALLYALGVREWDREGALKTWGNFS